MIFAIYFTSILVFLDLYGYYLRVKGTPRRYVAFALFGTVIFIGGFHLILLLGEPLVILLAWAAIRSARKNPEAAARRLPVLLGALFLAATLLFLNAHNTSESMFLSPHGVHYWLINVLNGFLAGTIYIAGHIGLEPGVLFPALEHLSGIPLTVSSNFPGVAAFFSLLGGYAIYLVLRARLPEGSLPCVNPDQAFTPSRLLVALLPVSVIISVLAAPSQLKVVAAAVLLFCTLCFSASGLYFTIRLSRRKLSGVAIFLVCAVQLVIFLSLPLMWLSATVGIAFRVFGLYTFIDGYEAATAVRSGPKPFLRIYLAPAAVILLLLPAKNFTDGFFPAMNRWLAVHAIPDMPPRMGSESARRPFVEIEDFTYVFDIDRYEFPNEPGVMPMLVKTAEEARAACVEHGLRLCRIDEWEHVCSSGGKQARIKRHEKTTGGKRKLCNQNENKMQPVGMPRFSDCRPDAYHVNGMAGNAWEIVETRDDIPATALKGGYYGYGDDYTTACSYTLIVINGQAEQMQESGFGFRCCR